MPSWRPATFCRGVMTRCLVVFADTPLVRPETFAMLLERRAAGAGVVALGFEPADPTGYGRLLTDADGELLAIREHKDASARGARGCACATPA